ncbi:MAG TPA: hypothetical protein VK522_12890 [Pseudolabrys sp.]|nr:hypothetical protein [Pseudolabrys sp.]
MPVVDFAQFHYFPALQTGFAEVLAYAQLAAAMKQRLVPIFELSQRDTAANFDEPIAEVRNATSGLSFLLDLSKDPAPAPYRYANEDAAKVARDTAAQTQYNNLLATLLSPQDGFAAWRSLVASFPNAIPVLQFREPAVEARQILRQAALLSHGDMSLAIRIAPDHADALSALVPQILSILRSPSQLLIIADCGQRRQQLSQRAQFAADTITRILAGTDISEQALVRAVCMSSWYSKPDQQGVHIYPSQDWALWREARETFPFAFGDYGAMHRQRRANTYIPGDFVATVTIPLDEGWHAYRHPNANERLGWRTGSEMLRDAGALAGAPACWGRDLVTRAATGDLTGSDRVRIWHASRVNLHLTKQIELAQQNVTQYESDDDE